MYAYLTFVTSPKIQWLVDFYSEFLDVAPVAKLSQEHVDYRTYLVDVVITQTTAGLDASAQREHRGCLLSFALAIDHMHNNENPPFPGVFVHLPSHQDRQCRKNQERQNVSA